MRHLFCIWHFSQAAAGFGYITIRIGPTLVAIVRIAHTNCAEKHFRRVRINVPV